MIDLIQHTLIYLTTAQINCAFISHNIAQLYTIESRSNNYFQIPTTSYRVIKA